MITKTFKAGSMFEALQLVQAELGPDAIVVSARDVPLGPAWNQWKQSGVEVVAMLPDAETKPAQKSKPGAVLRPSDKGMGVEFVEEKPAIEWVKEAGSTPVRQPVQPVTEPAPKTKRWEPQRLTREELNRTNQPARPAAEKPAPAVKPEPAPVKPLAAQDLLEVVAPEPAAVKDLPNSLKNIRARLDAQGVDKAIIDRMVDIAQRTFTMGALMDETACRKYFTQLLEAELRIQEIPAVQVPHKVMFLVGASGSGKTTTAAKLAMFYARQLNKKVVWVSADTVRTGAIAEARAYTDALGIPLKLAYTPADLREIIQEAKNADLILVDTAGYNPLDTDQVDELTSLLAESSDRRVYMVAAATMKDSDLVQISAVLGKFTINGVIVTKLDETFSYGSVYNFARKSQLGLSFFADGKGADGNIQAASASRIVNALMGKGWNK